jgi:hypothetical protein
VNDDPKRSFDTPDHLTRRQWILRLGESVALAGVSGLVPEVRAVLAAQQQAEPSKPTALPPGLYEPSQDHLVHALSSGGRKWTPPAGAETEFVLPAAVATEPQFFEADDFKAVTRIIEVLLGKVDSAASLEAARWFDLWLAAVPAVRTAAQQLDPLHRALAVAFYGETEVRELETADPDVVARIGIRALRNLSHISYQRDFLRLRDAEQFELLMTASRAEAGTDEHKFFELVRRESIRGYYTSAEGLKELDYRGNAYYGESPGCKIKAPGP